MLKNLSPSFSTNINKRILYLIRHGESIGNAHLPINCTNSQYPITKLGQKQAIIASNHFKDPPDIIYSSPFLRCKLTSEPLKKKFPNVPFILDGRLRAFTYLDSPYYESLRYKRNNHIKEYWDRLDPYYYDGPNSESFADYFHRWNDFYHSIHQTKEKCIIAYTHSMFIKLSILMSKIPTKNITECMKNFSKARTKIKVTNGFIYPIILE